MKKILAIAAILLLATFAKADGNVPGQFASTLVSITSMQASTTCVVSAAAAAAQAIATVPAVSGQFFYITHLEITYSAIAAPAATLMVTTTSNIPGSLTVSQPMQAAVGDSVRTMAFTTPIKSSVVGTAVVVTGNAGVTSISSNIRICGFYAP